MTAEARWTTWTRRLLGLAAVTALASWPWGPAPLAIPTLPPPTPSGCPDPVGVELQLVGIPKLVGYPLVGYKVEIDARHVKFQGSYPDSCQRPDFVSPVTDFEWGLEAPGSGQSLTDVLGLQPHLVLDTSGPRVVRLTVCPAGCTIAEPFGQLVNVAPQSVELAFEALASARLGPETMPLVPAQAAASPHVLQENHCGFDAGITAPQWYAVEQIEGPEDYRLAEGTVRKSRVSRKDSPLNHDSQDFNIYVNLDPQFRNVLFEPAEPNEALEVEWERGSLPERYRPTMGDRVSVFGHWIYDCAHSRHPEIHPPVGLAVHRPRPILIPSGRTFEQFNNQIPGTNVYVPGIITDVFFSTDGGDLMDCSTDTGLRNAEIVPPPPGGPPPPACLPAPSLDRLFEFDIYLPRNPRAIASEAGLSAAPPVPLFLDYETPPWASPGPIPILEPRPNAEAPTHVHVTLDLRGFAGSRYEKRIVTGWVLPAADNWGLGRWRLRLNRLDVFEDGDGGARGDGDWRLWVNTNNATNVGFPLRQEWIQVLNRDVNTGVENFGSQPWETGPSSSSLSRWLGPDLLRYPSTHQAIPRPRDPRILFHSTGYEQDNFTDDDAGTVSVMSAAEPQPAFGFSNMCHSVSDVGGLVYSGCVRYTAYFDVRRGPALPAASLSAGAKAVADAYVLPGCDPGSDPTCGLEPPIVGAAVEPPPVHPLDVHLGRRARATLFTEFGPFRPGGRERALTDITIQEFNAIVTTVRRTDPARVNRMLERLRAVLRSRLRTPALAGDVSADVSTLKAALPRDLWVRYFADIPRPHPSHDLPTGLLHGSGTVGSLQRTFEVSRIRVTCAQERPVNRLTVRWGSNRFDLDVLGSARCLDDPLVANSRWADFDTHRGMGIGRYNGVPGAVVEWTLVDGGVSGAKDSVALTIRAGADSAVVLSGSGTIRDGNLWALGRGGQP